MFGVEGRFRNSIQR